MKKIHVFLLMLFSIKSYAIDISVHQNGDDISYVLHQNNTPVYSEFFTSPPGDYTQGLVIEIFDKSKIIPNKNGDLKTSLGEMDSYLFFLDKTLVKFNTEGVSTKISHSSTIISQIISYYPSLDLNKGEYQMVQYLVFLKK